MACEIHSSTKKKKKSFFSY